MDFKIDERRDDTYILITEDGRMFRFEYNFSLVSKSMCGTTDPLEGFFTKLVEYGNYKKVSFENNTLCFEKNDYDFADPVHRVINYHFLYCAEPEDKAFFQLIYQKYNEKFVSEADFKALQEEIKSHMNENKPLPPFVMDEIQKVFKIQATKQKDIDEKDEFDKKLFLTRKQIVEKQNKEKKAKSIINDLNHLANILHLSTICISLLFFIAALGLGSLPLLIKTAVITLSLTSFCLSELKKDGHGKENFTKRLLNKIFLGKISQKKIKESKKEIKVQKKEAETTSSKQENWALSDSLLRRIYNEIITLNKTHIQDPKLLLKVYNV